MAVTVFLFTLFLALPVWAEVPVSGTTTLYSSGPAERKYDVVFIGDGFAEADQDRYNQVVQAIADYLWNEADVYSEYQNAFNYHRVNVVSPVSGTAEGTVLGAERYADTGGCCSFSTSLIREAARHAVSSPDKIVVIMHPKDYAESLTVLGYAFGPSGAGFGYVVIDSYPDTFWSEYGSEGALPSLRVVAAHELGHSIGGLKDEYVASEAPYNASTDLNCDERHTTREEVKTLDFWVDTPDGGITRRTVSWGDMIDPSTPLPICEATEFASDGTRCGYGYYDPGPVGLWKGCRSSTTYRSQNACMMEGASTPFCSVCRAIMTDTLLPYLNNPPVADAGEDLFAMAGSTVSVDASASYDPDGTDLSYTWRLLSETYCEPTALEAGYCFEIPVSTLSFSPNAVSSTATFTAPMVSSETTLTLVLTVSDGFETREATITVTVMAPVLDADNDRLTDDEEELLGTNPNHADTDRDGLNDREELRVHGTNPLLADSDADGLGDSDEISRGTDPNDNDSDDDGLADGREIRLGTSPTSADTDADGVGDLQDIKPLVRKAMAYDVNGDGVSDLIYHHRSTANRAGAVSVATGNAFGFGERVEWLGPWQQADSFTTLSGDFNGDGKTDLLFRDSSTGDTGGDIYINLSSGSRFYASSRWLLSSGTLSRERYDLHVGDFNGDSRDELLFREKDTGRLLVALANDNRFDPPQEWFSNRSTAGAGKGLVLGDFNGDARTDVALTSASGSIQVLTAEASVFSPAATWSLGYNLNDYRVIPGRFNNDALTDLALQDISEGESDGEILMLYVREELLFEAPIFIYDGFNSADYAVFTGQIGHNGSTYLAYRNEGGGPDGDIHVVTDWTRTARAWMAPGVTTSGDYLLVNTGRESVTEEGATVESPVIEELPSFTAPQIMMQDSVVFASPPVYGYTLSIANTGENPVPIYRLLVMSSGVSHASAPEGWTSSVIHDFELNEEGRIVETDTVIFSTDSVPVLPGDTLEDFSYQSHMTPEPFLWIAQGSDGLSFSGYTSSPLITP